MVVTGARQTDKTTLLTKLFPNYQYVSLDLPAEARLAEEDPQTFLARHPPPLLVDEVQYAPKLFRYLKVEIDRNRNANGRYILTGSQKLGLMREVSDSLAGWCGVLELEALSIHELGDVFAKREAKQGVAEALVRGFMLQLWKDLALHPVDLFGGYQATYLERDVRQILNVSSLRDFDRFMRAAAVRSGQLLNKTELAKEVGVSTKTINEWLGVLEATNQVTMLEPYFANVGKRLVKTPKLYFNDVGLLCFLLGLNRQVVTRRASRRACRTGSRRRGSDAARCRAPRTPAPARRHAGRSPPAPPGPCRTSRRGRCSSGRTGAARTAASPTPPPARTPPRRGGRRSIPPAAACPAPGSCRIIRP